MKSKKISDIDWDNLTLSELIEAFIFSLLTLFKYWLMGASYIIVLDLIIGLIAGIFSIKINFLGFSILAWKHYFYSLPILILLGGYTKDIKLFFYTRRLNAIVAASNKEFNDRKLKEPKPLDYKEPKRRKNK